MQINTKKLFAVSAGIYLFTAAFLYSMFTCGDEFADVIHLENTVQTGTSQGDSAAAETSSPSETPTGENNPPEPAVLIENPTGENNPPSTIVPPADNGSWNLLGNAGKPRYKAMTAVVGNLLYIYGGESNGSVKSDFISYDLSTKTVTVLQGGTPIADGTLILAGTKLLRFGGYNDSVALNQLAEYNAASNGWSVIQPAMTNGPYPDARYGFSTVVKPAVATNISVPGSSSSSPSTFVYIFGGLDSTGNATNEAYSLQYFSNTAIKPSWVKLKEIPEKVDHAAAYYYNDKVYLFTGHDSKMFVYSIASDSWTTLETAGAPSARKFFAYSYSSDSAYLFGGANDTKLLNDFWKYNFTENKWTTVKTNPGTRLSASLISYGKYMVLYGGKEITDSGLSDLWIFKP